MAAKRTTSTSDARSSGQRSPAKRRTARPAQAEEAEQLTPDSLQRFAELLAPMLQRGIASLPPAAPTIPPTIDKAMFGMKVKASKVALDAPLKPIAIEVSTSMDPRLQLAVANYRSGKPGLAMTSSTAEEHPVIARVGSADQWSAMPDVVPGALLGSSGDGSWVVTGRVPVAKLEAVRADPNVLSLKSSQLIVPQLAATIAAMGVAPAALPAGVRPQGGRGVIIGIVDFGGDFAHRNFRHANGDTRILALWNQAGIAKPNSPFGYGRLHLPAEINAALQTANPYAALGYGPARDTPTQIGAHGTHVMDIAAGNGLGTGQAGVAPEADIVFVEASITDVGGAGADAVGRFFGDSVQLLEAVRFIFDFAGAQPCVVNLSLGTNGGPHDGSSLVEMGLDALVNEKPNRAVVIAASNSQDHGIHTSGQVPAAGTHDLRWRQVNSGGGEIELWYPGDRRLSVSLVAADGNVLGQTAPGENLSLGSQGQIAVFLSNRLDDPNNHDNVISLFVADGLTDGEWVLQLQSLDGQPVEYHAWIERDDSAQASFITPVGTHTLGSISTGHDTVVVASYDAHKAAFPISFFSSAGPTRDGREKPEVSAPGFAVVAARSRTADGVTTKSGTSMATPAVSGLVALIYAEAQRNGQELTIGALRNRLFSGVRRDPPAIVGDTWDDRYGRGRASSLSTSDVRV